MARSWWCGSYIIVATLLGTKMEFYRPKALEPLVEDLKF